MDKLTAEQRHKNMSAIKSKDTKIELLVRKYLYSCGFRYRKNVANLPGKPDIAFPGIRTVIFVHGCFWHGHQNCKFATLPATRPAFWADKISKNRERDRKVVAEYNDMGWNVITVMECQLKPNVKNETLHALEKQVRAIRENLKSK